MGYNARSYGRKISITISIDLELLNRILAIDFGEPLNISHRIERILRYGLIYLRQLKEKMEKKEVEG